MKEFNSDFILRCGRVKLKTITHTHTLNCIHSFDRSMPDGTGLCTEQWAHMVKFIGGLWAFAGTALEFHIDRSHFCSFTVQFGNCHRK